jgi:hypothetical protein
MQPTNGVLEMAVGYKRKPGLKRKPKRDEPTYTGAGDTKDYREPLVKTRKRGQPTKYSPELDAKAFDYCLLGASDEDLAAMFEVEITTIHNWKWQHPSFHQSLKAGREDADARIANKLYHRALGYSHPDVHICTSQGKVFETPVTKHYPPEVTAMIFWLTNRNRNKWKRDGTGAGAVDREAALAAMREVMSALFPEAPTE